MTPPAVVRAPVGPLSLYSKTGHPPGPTYSSLKHRLQRSISRPQKSVNPKVIPLLKGATKYRRKTYAAVLRRVPGATPPGPVFWVCGAGSYKVSPSTHREYA